jgi:hypothetical protein
VLVKVVVTDDLGPWAEVFPERQYQQPAQEIGRLGKKMRPSLTR